MPFEVLVRRTHDAGEEEQKIRYQKHGTPTNSQHEGHGKEISNSEEEVWVSQESADLSGRFPGFVVLGDEVDKEGAETDDDGETAYGVCVWGEYSWFNGVVWVDVHNVRMNIMKFLCQTGRFKGSAMRQHELASDF